MNAPSPFSLHNPNLQVAWDSTSLRALMFCPTFYKKSIIDGYVQSAVDLEFGIYFATGAETYKKARLDGKSRDEAQLIALKRVIWDSWIRDIYPIGPSGGDIAEGDGYPWGGTYQEQWRCTGTEPYKNNKGNKAKCPWSHKGKWFPDFAPSTCGTCGSPTETERQYVPGNKYKNRHTLIRLLAWYIEEQPEDLNVGLAPYKFPNGQPAVELSGKMPLPFTTKQGEPYIICVHLDSIMVNGDEKFISDNKTTKNALTNMYWKQFAPNVQVDTYDLVGSVLFPQLNIKGVIIEAAQTMVEGARFGSQPFYRNEEQREEFLRELEWWIKQAEQFAEDDYWPMNRTNCKMCIFQSVCSRSPQKREEYLKADFTIRKWNPLIER